MTITALAQSFYLGDSASLDAFDRLRVSTPSVMLDCKMTAGILATRWLQATATGGTVAATTPTYGAVLANTATNGSSAILQTKQRGIYQAGRSLMALATFNFNVAGNGTANVRKRVGMFDDLDGIFFEQNGTDVRFTLRSSVVGGVANDTNYVARAGWSVDKFDGTGPSGITLDFTKTQIFFTDIEWLGVGRVRVGFVVDGIIYYAHHFKNANNLAVPYMANPNLPIRYECVATAAAAIDSMLAICCTIISEGGFEQIGRLASAGTGAAGRAAVPNNRAELIGLRLGSLTTNYIRKGMLLPDSLSLYAASTAVLWELVLNAVPTGVLGAGTWVAVADSMSEYNILRTASTGFTGGYSLASGFLPSLSPGGAQLGLNSVLSVAALDLTAAPASDILSLLVTPISGGNQTYSATLNWRELR